MKQFRKIQEETSSAADAENIEDAIDFVDNSGQTALRRLLDCRVRSEGISVLVKECADASLVDNKGRTAKKVATKKGYDDLSKVLRKAEKESEKPEEKMGKLQVGQRVCGLRRQTHRRRVQSDARGWRRETNVIQR